MITASDYSRTTQQKSKVGLVLSGGGARGAYQAGVTQAIAEIASAEGMNNPFPIVTGVSAGAINAAFLASSCDNFLAGTDQLSLLWSRITADRIFKTDALSAGRSGLRFMTDAMIGAFYKKKLARALLDTKPLGEFISASIPFEKIRENLEANHLEAFALSAMNYTDSTSITFVQNSSRPQPQLWERSRRKSEMANIYTDHVMASAALPLFFPPVKVHDDHYGDGCLRNTAPLSPAIHLGANRLLVISTRMPDAVASHRGPGIEPSLARVLGVLLNAVLLDAIDIDMERMSRINQTISIVPEHLREGMPLKKVDYLWIRPSQDIGKLAGDLFDRLPSVIKYLISGLGSSKEASELTSYLLFDPDYCGQLVRIGYEDGLSHRDEILRFISV